MWLRRLMSPALVVVLGSCAAACEPAPRVEDSDSEVRSDTAGSDGEASEGVSSEQAATSTSPPPSPETPAAPEGPQPAVCDANTCADGCCVEGRCFTDHVAAHCATGGVACPAACGADTSCVKTAETYACAPLVSGLYEVVLVGTVVRNGADGSGDYPDLYVNGGAFGGLPISRTSVISNVTSATWNQTLGTADASYLLGKQVTVEIKDSDSFSSDSMVGTCTHTLTAAEIGSGSVVIPDEECTSYVQSVTFTLRKVGS
jgi:hypothetical protein